MAPLLSDSLLLAVFSPLIYGLVCLRINKATFQGVMAAAFVAGFATSFVAYIIEVAFTDRSVFYQHQLFGFFALIAAPEETVKLAALIGLTGKDDRFGYAALIIACFIGCGFAASENLVYLQKYGSGAVSMRFFTATAFHVFNAIIMARIVKNSLVKDEALRIVLALIIAMVLHGAYDYLIAQSGGDDGRFVFVLCFTVAAGIVTLRSYPMIRQRQELPNNPA